MIWKRPIEDDFKSVGRSEKAFNSVRSLPNGDGDKLSLQGEDNANVMMDETVRSSKKSSCISEQKSLATVSNRSKDSKKEIQEKTQICKCISQNSVNPKSSASTSSQCQCRNTKSRSSGTTRIMKNLKTSSDSCSKRSVTSNASKI